MIIYTQVGHTLALSTDVPHVYLPGTPNHTGTTNMYQCLVKPELCGPAGFFACWVIMPILHLWPLRLWPVLSSEQWMTVNHRKVSAASSAVLIPQILALQQQRRQTGCSSQCGTLSSEILARPGTGEQQLGAISRPAEGQRFLPEDVGRCHPESCGSRDSHSPLLVPAGPP